jgi:hypothetical protein
MVMLLTNFIVQRRNVLKIFTVVNITLVIISIVALQQTVWMTAQLVGKTSHELLRIENRIPWTLSTDVELSYYLL